MAKIIKSYKITWTWEGDSYALRFFKVALTQKGSDPNDDITALATTGKDKFEHTFRDVIVDDSTDYTAWVQAVYENKDSDWLSATDITVSDDGTATIETESSAQTKINDAKDFFQKTNWKYEGNWDIFTTGKGFDFAFNAIPDVYQDYMKLRVLQNDLEVNIRVLVNGNDLGYINGTNEITEWKDWQLNSSHLNSTSDNVIRIEHDGTIDDWGYIYQVVLEFDGKRYTDDAESNAKSYMDENGLIDGISAGGILRADMILNQINGNPNDGEVDYSQKPFTFIHPNGNEYTVNITEGGTATSLEGVTTGWAYLAYVGTDQARFTTSYSKEILAIRYNNGQWQYNDNNNWNNFTPNENDCIVAKIEKISTVGGIDRLIRYASRTGETESGAQNRIEKFTSPSKPQGAHLWHFDRSVVSTDGLQPENNAVYTLRPGGGKYGGALAVEKGTTNFVLNPLFVDTSNWLLATSGAGTFTALGNWGKIDIPVGESGKYYYLYQTIVRTTPANTKVAFSITFKNNIAGKFALRLVMFVGAEALQQPMREVNLDGSGVPKRYSVTAVHTAASDRLRIDLLAGSHYSVGGGLSDSDVEFSYAQLEQTPFPTSFVDGIRANGTLSYKHIPNDWDAYTIAAWTKRDDISGWGSVVSSWTNFYFMWKAWSQNTIRFSWVENGVQKVLEGIKIGIDCREWNYVACSYDRAISTAKIYINGEKVSERNNVICDKADNVKGLSIGTLGFTSTSYPLNGLIDEVLILPDVASDEEIQSWYNSQAPFYDPESVIGAGRMQITSDGLKAYNANGVKTVDIGSAKGNIQVTGHVIGAVYNE